MKFQWSFNQSSIIIDDSSNTKEYHLVMKKSWDLGKVYFEARSKRKAEKGSEVEII